MKKSIFACMLCLLALSACGKETETKQDKPNGCGDEPICDVGKSADMSAYEGFMETNHRFIEAPMKDFLIKLDNQASAVYYFGYSTCPWCVEALPIMNEVAEAENINIFYIDKKAETSDDESAAAIEARLGDILDRDDEGKPHLYVPFVVVIKDGEVIAHHTGTLDSHDAHERKMNEDEKQELKAIYEEMFAKLAS